MKQVLQSVRSGITVVRDVPAPPCPPGGVLVRNEYSVVSSGTERARTETFNKSLLGKARERPDLVREVLSRARREGISATRRAVEQRLNVETPAGYSCAGRVLEVGEHARELAPGDAVACGGAGHANHAEIVTVPSNLCAKVPDSVALEAAAFTTIAAIALHAVRLAEARLGERVAVLGCGLVGQIALRLLRCGGVETIALDIAADRVAEALRGGADHGAVIDDSCLERVRNWTCGHGADQVIVAAAAPTRDPLVLATRLARDRGVIVLLGVVPIELPRTVLYEKELSFRVSRSYGPGRYDPEYEERGLDYPIGYVRWSEQRNMECVLDLQARGQLDLVDLIDEVVPVDDAAKAYDRLRAPEGQRPRGAIVLRYGPASKAIADGGSATAIQIAPQSAGEAPLTESPRRGILHSATPRLGLVGPGSFATRTIVPAFLAAGVRLELVGGGFGPSSEAAVRTGGFARYAASAEAVVEDPHVDLVAICTRHASHAELAVRALGAGKHVFVEKPLALTHSELEAVIVAAQRSQGILAVGFNRRFSPFVEAVRGFIVAGGGPITAAYRVSAGRVEATSWIHDLSQGGGRLVGEVSHFIDTLASVAYSPVVSVHAVAHGGTGLPRQAEDNVVVSLSFANRSAGSIVYVSDGAPKVAKERLEVFSGSRTAILSDYRSLELHAPGGRRRLAARSQDKGHRAEIRAFVQGATQGRPPVAIEEIENVSLTSLAAVESLRTGLAVRLSPASGV